MVEIGRLCVKLAGRDAGKKCVVVEVLDKNFVTIDGETRRKRCNIIHLEPFNQKLKIKAKASHDSVVSAFKDELKIEIKERKKKEKTERPKKVRKQKEKRAEEKPKTAKKAAKTEKKEAKTVKKEEAKPSEKKEEPKK
jgi:large subunit ribosomal protein L14e